MNAKPAIDEEALGTAAKSRKKRAVLPFTPEAPPTIVEGHVQEIAGARRGAWRQANSDPLRTYADHGQINEDQFEAGKWYEEKYLAKSASGRDSTDLDRVSGGGAGLPISLIQAEAMKQIIAVDTRLSQENRTIIRAICGDGHHASHVIRMVTGEQGRTYPIPRFREALNALRSAILSARKDKWTALLQTVNT